MMKSNPCSPVRFGLLAGVALIAIGLWLLLDTGTVVAQAPIPVDTASYPAMPLGAQQPEGAEYVGARECQSCHRNTARSHNETRHALTLREANGDVILGNFDQDAEVRTVQFPGEDAARPFTAADIAWVVGSGRNIQRYLYQVERGQYLVLPAEWNVVEQKWQPYSPATSWPDPAFDWTQNCAGCHTTGLNSERGRWEDEAVQCESCHGPGSVHAEVADDAGNNPNEEELVSIRQSIVVSPDPQICGQCHSQGTASADGRPYPVNYLPGQVLTESFTLSQPDDSAHWRASGHAASQNMQYNEWLLSGHARSLENLKASEFADDSCLECHSADYQPPAPTEGEQAAAAPVTLETAQYGVTCTGCHTLHSDAPLEYQLNAEPYAQCISCHADDRLEQVHFPVKEMFEGEPVVDQIAGVPSKHFTEGVICTTCHMPTTQQTSITWFAGSHTMTPVLPSQAVGEQPDSCTGCHTDLSRSYMQRFIDETQSGILQRLTDAQVALGTRSDAPPWVLQALEFVGNDGSLGVHNFSYASKLLDTVELELGITQSTVASNLQPRPIENPTDCAECHMDEYRQWQTSPHANASLMDTFQQEYARQGRPSYCMSCHASGYDPRTEEYVFEGVVCSNCHYVQSNAEHPPGPVEIATDSAVCGQCHSGEHAPTYDEWLVSSHATAGIDCADCHTPHNNGLLLNDVNATCASCHEEAMLDEIHMGEDMDCVDCHMTQRRQDNGVFVVQTGHAMSIDPGVCADCHGNIHLLSFGETRPSEGDATHIESLEQEVTQLQDTAVENLNTGIVGGAIGALVLMIVAYVVIRLGRLR